MTGLDEEESYGSLAEHRLGRSGLLVKLDRGFEHGVYGVRIEYDGLAERVGFAAARRQALAFAERLREQLSRRAGHDIQAPEDADRSGGPRRKHDLECTFVSFGVATPDGRWHDAGMTERFRVALLRAGQEWDQVQARDDERRRDGRRDRFRQRLDALLDGAAYRHLDTATRERLGADIMELVFPPRGRGR